jgi:archaellum component FlaF (FlaF/FlaG flagellin family)
LGQETVIGGVCFVAILLLSCYVYADSANRLSTISWRSLEVASSISSEKLNSRLSITGLAVAASRTKLYVNVTNDGTLKIAKSSFAQIDVILTYTNEGTDVAQTYWCHFDSSDSPIHDSSIHRWSLNSSLVPNPYPGIVNPLDWDPSETLSLVVELSASNQFRSDTGHDTGYVKIVLPQGSSNSCSFSTGDENWQACK